MSTPLPSLSQALHFQSAVLFLDDLSELVVSVILGILEKKIVTLVLYLYVKLYMQILVINLVTCHLLVLVLFIIDSLIGSVPFSQMVSYFLVYGQS